MLNRFFRLVLTIQNLKIFVFNLFSYFHTWGCQLFILVAFMTFAVVVFQYSFSLASKQVLETTRDIQTALLKKRPWEISLTWSVLY